MTSKKLGFTRFIGKFWLLIFVFLLWIVFSILLPRFFTGSNIISILSGTCITAIAALGLTSICTAGEIDFSAGTQVSAATVFMGVLLGNKVFTSFWTAALATIAILMVVGVANSILHVKFKIPAFIASMGMSYVLKAVCKYISNGGATMYRNLNWPKNYSLLGQGRLFGVIPYTIIVMVVSVAIMFIFTERTRWGKYLYAVGSNGRCCDYLGINSGRQKTIGFVLCSFWSAIAGIVMTSQLNAAGVSVGDTMIQSLTVLNLGATFLKQGTYNVSGTVLASFMLTSMFYGMKMMGAGAWAEDLVEGLILVCAVSVVTVIRRRIGKR